MLSRRDFLGQSAATVSLAAAGGALAMPALAKGMDRLTIWGPPAGPSIVLAHLVETNALKDFAKKTTFKIWRDPNQLRAGFSSGSMVISGTPTYVGANLFNRGLDARLANVVTWGLLYLMSRDETIHSIKDLRGKHVLMPFRGDMPDLVLQAIARKVGLVVGRDFKVSYTGTPQQAMKLMLAGKADSAILPEPAATGAQMLGIKKGLKIRRAVDMQKEWGRAQGGRSAIPQAGMMMSGSLLKNEPELLGVFQKAMVKSGRWVRNNPGSAAGLGAAYMGLKKPIIERSIPYSNIDVRSAASSRSDLQRFFKVLHGMSPAIIGGRLPGKAFYL